MRPGVGQFAVPTGETVSSSSVTIWPLDFLNTRPVQNGEPTELLSDFARSYGGFRQLALLSSREEANLQRQSGTIGPARRTPGSHARISGEAEKGDSLPGKVGPMSITPLWRS